MTMTSPPRATASPVPLLHTEPAPPLTATSTSSTASCCPSCGTSIPAAVEDQELAGAQIRIRDLEAQVRLLNEKATAAVDRWADYEDEISKLRRQSQPPPPPPPKTPEPQQQRQHQQTTPQSSPSRGILQSGAHRLSALLSPRRSVDRSQALHPDSGGGGGGPPHGKPQPKRSLTTPNPLTAPATAEDLREALTREQSLRREAEGRLTATSKEVEELSVSLFEQANQMVADERRARAKLEERVGELERRDVEKRRRLERLEMAMGRIERVRKVLEEDE